MWERLGSTLFWLLVVFLAFTAGALVMAARIPPYTLFEDAYRAGVAANEQRKSLIDPYANYLWADARRPERGVTVRDDGRAQPGYTLYTSGDGAHARLIDMNGRLLHEWSLPYSAVWNAGAAVTKPQPDHLIYYDMVRLFPNGDLLAIYTASGDTPWGYGMVKMDRNGRPLWSYLQHTHHAFDVAPDGRIFVLIHQFHTGFHRDWTGEINVMDRVHLDDCVAILAPDGRELQRIPLLEALAGSGYHSLLWAVQQLSRGDPLHTNAIQYIDAARARHFAVGKEGQLLVDFRDLGAVAVLDIPSGKVVWATRGPWLGEHDPTIMASGDILLFDNMGGYQRGNASRLVQFDPASMQITWLYRGDAEHPFHSTIRSSAQRLANGDTLVTESDGGRLFEVDPTGVIVWEYMNPVRRGERNQHIPVVSAGQRIDPDALQPDFRTELARAGAQ